MATDRVSHPYTLETITVLYNVNLHLLRRQNGRCRIPNCVTVQRRYTIYSQDRQNPIFFERRLFSSRHRTWHPWRLSAACICGSCCGCGELQLLEATCLQRAEGARRGSPAWSLSWSPSLPSAGSRYRWATANGTQWRQLAGTCYPVQSVLSCTNFRRRNLWLRTKQFSIVQWRNWVYFWHLAG
jgi:hypothetical protein